MSSRGDFYITSQENFRELPQTNRYLIAHDANYEYIQKLLKQVDFKSHISIANQIITLDPGFIELDNADEYGGFTFKIIQNLDHSISIDIASEEVTGKMSIEEFLSAEVCEKYKGDTVKNVFLDEETLADIKSRYYFATCDTKQPIGVIAKNEELIEHLEQNYDGKWTLPTWSRQLDFRPINGFKPLYSVNSAGIDFTKDSSVVKLHWTGFIGEGTSYQKATIGKDIELLYLVPTLRDGAEDVYTYHALESIKNSKKEPLEITNYNFECGLGFEDVTDYIPTLTTENDVKTNNKIVRFSVLLSDKAELHVFYDEKTHEYCYLPPKADNTSLDDIYWDICEEIGIELRREAGFSIKERDYHNVINKLTAVAVSIDEEKNNLKEGDVMSNVINLDESQSLFGFEAEVPKTYSVYFDNSTEHKYKNITLKDLAVQLDLGFEALVCIDNLPNEKIGAVVIYDSTEEEGLIYEAYDNLVLAKKDFVEGVYENSIDAGIVDVGDIEDTIAEAIDMTENAISIASSQKGVRL